MSRPQRLEHADRGGDPGQPARHPTTVRQLPAEAYLASTSPTSILNNPDLAGNPVALAHARAGRGGHSTATAAGHPAATPLVFLVVMPTIILLVSNPLGWLVLLMLCFVFAYLIGFGGSL